MKILFIGSSLEPGGDGVGDYLRRLAAELITQGHVVRLAALNDGSISTVTEEKQSCEGGSVLVLRLPAVSAWRERTIQAQLWVKHFDPDWISLHYVPFGFQPKGLPWGFGQNFEKIAGRRRLHIMFHELWVGFRSDSSLKLRGWGWVQRQLIQRMIAVLQPRLVHSSNETYATLLRSIAVRAKILPLFSTVRVFPKSGWLGSELCSRGIAMDDRASWLLLGVFGTIVNAWTDDRWWVELVGKAQQQGRRVALLGIGKASQSGLNHFYAANKAGFVDVWVHHYGVQSEERISDFLQTIDGGISMSVRALLGKSTAAAAMAEHGVPMVIPRIDGEADRFQVQLQVRKEIEELFVTLGQPRIISSNHNQLKRTARLLLEDFATAT